MASLNVGAGDPLGEEWNYTWHGRICVKYQTYLANLQCESRCATGAGGHTLTLGCPWEKLENQL